MLITLSQYKSWTNTTTSDNDTLLTLLISACSNEVEAYCDRTFNAAQYIEWIKTQPCSNLYNVRQYPIQYIQFIGEAETAISLTNTDNVSYNILIKDKNMYVTPDDTLTTAIYDLSNVATDTVTEVAGVLDALSNVSATVSSTVNQNAKLLKEYNYMLDNSIDMIGAVKSESTAELIDDRTIRMDCGGTYCIVYYAGYTTIPDDLQKTVANIVRDALDVALGDVNSNIKSESETNYSYSLQDTVDFKAIVFNYRGALDVYRNISIV